MATHTSLSDLFTDIADEIRSKKGNEETIVADDFPSEIANLPKEEEPIHYTGHVDREGLAHIGWTEDEIDYLQENGVFWDEELDDFYKLTEEELEGITNTNTRYLPANTGRTSLSYYNCLIGCPTMNFKDSTSSSVFTNCWNLHMWPLTNGFPTSCVAYISQCYHLKEVPNLNVPVENMNGMFSECYSLNKVGEIIGNSCTNAGNLFNKCYNLKSIKKLYLPSNKKGDYMFAYCDKLYDFGNINVGEITSAKHMFYNNYGIKKIPEIDTHLCTDFTNFAYESFALNDISNLDTSAGINFTYAFRNCKSLQIVKELDLSNAENLSYMFDGCSSLNYVKITNFDASKITNSSSMFNNCRALRTLILDSNDILPYGSGLLNGTGISYNEGGYVYVPDNLVDSYKAASGWSSYKNYIKGISQLPSGD